MCVCARTAVPTTLTAMVTTVRSAKAVITTFCRMLSCGQSGRINTNSIDLNQSCVSLTVNESV